MSTDNNVFTFELNESLYFEKGQEVSEMLKISLDPEISIQPFSEYVSIRGVVELQGEYQKSVSMDGSENNISNIEEHSQRYLERIEDIDDGKARFSHRFPVEISVPSYRVADMNDITVSIESFDYEIPTESQLKLMSTIEIQGISNQDRPMEEIEDDVDEEVDNFIMDQEEAEIFEFEVKGIDEDKQDDAGDEDVAIVDSLNTSELTFENDTVIDEPSHPSQETEKGRWKSKKSQSITDFFKEKSPKSSLEADTLENQDSKEEAEDEQMEEIAEIEENEITSSSSDASLNIKENADVDPEMDQESVEDVSYLSDMFRGANEEEQYSQMRICIVQQKDTIESIAERYQISALQILKQNRLDNDNVIEGQLLSIPYKKK